MSEDPKPYKPITGLPALGDEEKRKRYLVAALDMGFENAAAIRALASRVGNLEQDQKQLRLFIERILTPSLN